MNWVNNYAELKYWEEVAGITVATIFVIGWAIVLIVSAIKNRKRANYFKHRKKHKK